MDIVVQREALLKPLQAVSGVVERKQTLPILSNVLLTIRDGRLLLTGTDLEIELVGFVRIENQSADGVATVSARKLFDICRTLPEGSALRLSLEKNYLVVRAGESCFMLNTLPAQDFPSLEDSQYASEFTIRQNSLKNLLTKTYFAMGQQDVRHYLNGAFLDIGQQSIKCVAADGHRLALSSLHDEAIGNVEARIILPRKSVLELIRLLGGDMDSDITLHIGENRARFVTPDFIFTTKLINAQYPDYNRLIPKGTTTALGDRESIKQALTRASILSNEKFRGVRFQLEPSKLRITANNSDQEHAEEAVTLEYAGNNMEIGFNVAYLLDVVSAITTKAIRCVFTSPNDGVLIEPAEGDHSLYVVMPMRL
ncbi:DNA polymerase III subunit beta [Aquicella siphonis]|uniref:Beta sliding clamp n=1 Tax=Aquicella siphonis TaxID=254247 RepID=A0A5E4PKN6_9COXI|nr:DNA polymerase III subunit beta [Aquicella siphonis]VVC76893.1 DNA polymerase III subunit beta [Aquicella siphonis]